MNCGLDVQRHTFGAHYKNFKSHPILNTNTNKFRDVCQRLSESLHLIYFDRGLPNRYLRFHSEVLLGTFWHFLLELVIFQGPWGVGISNKYLQPPIYSIYLGQLSFSFTFLHVLSALNMYQSLICRRPLQPFHLEKNDKNGSAWVSNLLNFLNVNKSLFLLPLAHVFFSTVFFATVQYWTVFVKIQSLQLTKNSVLILATDLWFCGKQHQSGPRFEFENNVHHRHRNQRQSPQFWNMIKCQHWPDWPTGGHRLKQCLTFCPLFITPLWICRNFLCTLWSP